MRSNEEPAGRVLIVEDNRNISEMVGEYLEGRGFEVDYASDGAVQMSVRPGGNSELATKLLEDKPVKAGLPVPKKQNPEPKKPK